jgi:alpha-tubulin suppressor-like RCC1 family protein
MSLRLAGAWALTLFVCLAVSSAASAAGGGVPYVSGYNAYNNLGDGSLSGSYRYAPELLAGLSGVVSASTGYYDTMAVLANGSVYGWGDNQYGELGDGTNTKRETPELIPGLSGVSALSEGYYFTVALMADGTVKDWGSGSDGELGVGSVEEHHSPVTVPGVEHAVQVSAGCYSTYALLANGTVMAWGDNADGELGDGTIEERKSPVPVPGLEHVVAIAAGCNFAMALLANGTVKAWGANAYGELGDGTIEERKLPVAVAGVSGVTAIAAGSYFGLALTASGTVDGWGYNRYHELGDGTEEERKTAEQIPGVANVAQIAAGGYYSLALLSDGAVEGWGYAEDGELGNGTDIEQGTHLLLAFPDAAIGLASGGGGYSYTSLVIEGARGRVSNTSLAFAAQTAGTTSAAQSVTVTNEGPASLSISGDALSGVGASAFHETADSCAGATLAVGAGCTISLAFAPSAGGEAVPTMAISSSAVGGLSRITLSGTGVAATTPAAPSLGALALSPSTFRAARSGASAETASIATGTFVVYTDSQAATATFLVEQKSRGVVSHGKCVAAPKHPKRKGAKRCSLYKQLGSFTHADTVGTDALRFTGRVAGRSLAAGSYRLSASSHGAGGTSATRTATFTVTH